MVLFIIIINSLRVLNNRLFSKRRQAFTMTHNMVSSGLWKILYFPIFILTTYGTTGCVMCYTWCLMILYLIVVVGIHTYSTLWDADTCCEPPAHIGGYGSCTVGNWNCERITWDEVRGVEQDFIPYGGQLKLPNVSIEGWIIDLDVHGLHDGPCDVVQFHTHNGEVVQTSMMTCGVRRVTDGGRCLRCSFSLSLKVLANCPVYYSSHLYLYITPFFCMMIALPLRATRRPLMTLPHLK